MSLLVVQDVPFFFCYKRNVASGFISSNGAFVSVAGRFFVWLETQAIIAPYLKQLKRISPMALFFMLICDIIFKRHIFKDLLSECYILVFCILL